MDIRVRRSWMYNRLMPGRKGNTDAFTKGVEEFVSFVCQKKENMSNGEIRCPCSKCKNTKHFHPEEVKVHLYRKGFKPDYWYWSCHGESDPELCAKVDTRHRTTTTAHEGHNEHSSRFESMIYDAIGPEYPTHQDIEMDESPNIDDQEFYDLLNAAQKPLWSGCNNHTELSVAVRLLTIKSEGNISQRSFNQIVALMKETHPPNNLIPKDYYKANKLVSKLGLTSRKIDCCVNGCMLFYTDECKELKECKFCGASRYEKKKVGRERYKEVPLKRMHYLPLIPRLKRLYASMSSDHDGKKPAVYYYITNDEHLDSETT